MVGLKARWSQVEERGGYHGPLGFHAQEKPLLALLTLFAGLTSVTFLFQN